MQAAFVNVAELSRALILAAVLTQFGNCVIKSTVQ